MAPGRLGTGAAGTLIQVTDPLGVDWEVSGRRRGLGRTWVVEARSERGELGWRVRGARRARRAETDVAAAFARGERSFSPAGAQRLLPVSPLSSHEQPTVRVLP
jgi:hypothetical protein